MSVRDLLFSEWPMFDRVLETDHGICQRILETVLGITVDSIDNVIAERAVSPRVGSHGVRFDALVHAGARVFDVEMQCSSRDALGRRMRYYQGSMDSVALRPGENYGSLPESYIVFICTEDQFNRERPTYSFNVTCEEDDQVVLDHGFRWIVLNASAWRSLPTGRLRSLLQYIDTQESNGDALVDDIVSAVARANHDAVWKAESLVMISMEEDLREQARLKAERAEREGLERGLAEGLAEGEERFASLVAALVADGRMEDMASATADKGMRARLYEEYEL